MASICVFCGSRSGLHPQHAQLAAELGMYLAAHGHTLVYGGGSTGVMGALSDSMLAHGGQIIGVITQQLATPELMHTGVEDMRVTANMHERKKLMHDLADAYVALPGGLGTMEELFEAVTWAQLELHAHPIAVMNSNGLYDGLVQLLQSMIEQQFASERCCRLLTVTTSLSELTGWIETIAHD